MSSFDEKYAINRQFGEDNYEFYEDTHDERGNYAKRVEPVVNPIPVIGREDTFTPRPNNIVSSPIEQTKEEKVEEKEQERVVSFKDITISEPIVEKEAENIIKNLKRSEPVVINFSACEDEVAQRVLDFVSGAAFALDGTMRKVSNGLFLAVPKNVKVIITEDNE